MYRKGCVRTLRATGIAPCRGGTDGRLRKNFGESSVGQSCGLGELPAKVDACLLKSPDHPITRHNVPFLMNDASEEFPSEPVQLCGVTCIPPRYKMQLEPLACKPCHLLQGARFFEKVSGSGDNLQTLLAAKLL